MAMSTIEHARNEQRRCAEQYHDAGARLGMNDWFCEEFLMQREMTPPVAIVGEWYRHRTKPEKVVTVVRIDQRGIVVRNEKGRLDTVRLPDWLRMFYLWRCGK